MKYLEVTKDNIDNEHICCAISNSKNDSRVVNKKNWMKNNFNNGLKFIKLDERGKVFIEYMIAEKAWAPIEAPNYYYINCFWVSGKFVKQGHGSKLLEMCLEDAKKSNKDGVVILSSKKKMAFLSDPKFLKKKGFIVCDNVAEYVLLYFPLKKDAKIPKFVDSIRSLKIKDKGIVIYYSNQCPHTKMYVDIIEGIAQKNNIEFKKIEFTSYLEAQKAPAPFTTYSFFDDGKFVTNEIFSAKKFEKYLVNRK